MTHSRSATRPMPVIRPAARMASSYMSSAASGDNSRNGVPASISVMTRSRGRSLPRAKWRSRERGGPPSAAAARRACSSVTSACMAVRLARNSGDVGSIADLIAVTSPSSMRRPPACGYKIKQIDKIAEAQQRHRDCIRGDQTARIALGLIITRNRFGTPKLSSQACVRKGEPSRSRRRMLRKDGHRGGREMKYKHTPLLAGIAALALVGGTGLASAQDSSKSESGKSATPHATQQMNQGGTSSQSSQGAQTQERGSMSKQGQRAEDSGKASKGEKATTGQGRAQKEEQNRSAQSNEKKGTTAGSNESQAGKAAQERNKSETENERLNRGKNAQEAEHRGGKNAAERTRPGDTSGTAAEQQNRTGAPSTNAQRGRTGTEGLQGNATGMNVHLNEQQRNEIRTTVINARGAPRV